MQYLNNIVTVSVADLVKCGVSMDTIKYGLQMQRQGKVYCWAHTKQGNTVYIHYDGLKDKYKALVKTHICGGLEPAEYLANEDAKQREKKLTAVFASIPSLLEISHKTLESIGKSGLLKPADVQRVARTEAWLRLARNMNVKKARECGCTSVNEMQNEVFKHYLNEQVQGWVLTPKPINNIQVFNRLARKWQNEGYTALLHKGLGNQNRTKIDKVIHAKLISLAGNPVKYSFEDIAMKYNDFAEQNGLEALTVSAIKKYLNKPVVKKVWYYLRHGKHEADKVLRQEIARNKPSFPDALWSIDGTTMQMYYRGANGKMCSELYVILVSDAHSGAIIGHSVGYVENSGLVVEALSNAIRINGYKPYQLQYDNGSANISKVVKSLMDNMTHIHFPCRPRHAKGKFVEGVIGHFQQCELRKYKEFKGGNITTKSADSQANPELLELLKKNPELLKDEAGIIEAFNDAVNDWNARGERRNKFGQHTGIAKIEKYNKTHERRVKLDYFERISLFVVEVPNNKRADGAYVYGQRGIEINVSGSKLQYIVPDGDGIGDFIFARENLGKSFKVRIDVATDHPSFISLYSKQGKYICDAFEKERYASCVADMQTNEMSKIRQFIAKADAEGYTNAKTELELQREILQEAGYFSTNGTDSAIGLDWRDTPKIYENKRQGKLEDARNGVADTTKVLTLLEKQLSRIGR